MTTCACPHCYLCAVSRQTVARLLAVAPETCIVFELYQMGSRNANREDISTPF